MDQADPSSVEIEQVTPVNKAMEQTASASEVVEQAISVSEVIEQVVSVFEVTERATSVSEVIERVISVIEVMEQIVSEVIGQVYPPSEPDKQFALKASSLSWFSKNKNDFMIGRNDGPSRKKSKIDDDCIILENSSGCQFNNERMIFEDGQLDTSLMHIYNKRLSDTVRERSFIFPSVNFKYIIGFLREFSEKSINQEKLRMVFDVLVNFDFFKKDVIVIPICMDLQWSMAIICYPGLIPQIPDNTPYLKALCRKFLNAQVKPFKLSSNDRSSNSKTLAASARNVQQDKVPCIYLFRNRRHDSNAIFNSIQEFLEQLWQIKNKDKSPGKVLDFRTVRCLEMHLPEVDMAFEQKLVHIVDLFLMNPVPCTNLELFNNYFPAEVQIVAKSNTIPPPLDLTANLLFHFLYHITSKEIPDLAGWNPDTLPQWEEYLNWF